MDGWMEIMHSFIHLLLIFKTKRCNSKKTKSQDFKKRVVRKDFYVL